MIRQTTPRKKALVSWSRAGAWLAFIYLMIPFARSIQVFVYERADKYLFLWLTFLALAAGAGRLILHAARKQWRISPDRFLALLFIGGLYSWVIWSLRVHPEEAFHLVEYGVLGLLLFHALSHHLKDPSIYAVAMLAGAAFGILDELIQWIVPNRCFDYRDIGINLMGTGLMQLALALGVRPASVHFPLSERGIKSAGLSAALCLLLLSFCLFHVDNPFIGTSPPQPQPAAFHPLKIVFFTDVHARTEWETPKALRQAATAINAQHADLVICGGDMITEGPLCSETMAGPRWEVYRTMRNAIHPRPIEVIGNHDLVGLAPADGTLPPDDPRAQVRTMLDLPQTYRSFGRAGVHFILLDSIELTRNGTEYRGHIRSEQMDWLQKDLALVPSNAPIVMVTHIPLLTDESQIATGPGQPPDSDRYITNNREVLDAFTGHRLLAVLQGHLHVNAVMYRQGTAFITGGSICGEWWRGPCQDTPPGFGVLLLNPDHVEWTYHPYEWEPRRPGNE